MIALLFLVVVLRFDGARYKVQHSFSFCSVPSFCDFLHDVVITAVYML
jgi:hypothetical protein